MLHPLLCLSLCWHCIRVNVYPMGQDMLLSVLLFITTCRLPVCDPEKCIVNRLWLNGGQPSRRQSWTWPLRCSKAKREARHKNWHWCMNWELSYWICSKTIESVGCLTWQIGWVRCCSAGWDLMKSKWESSLFLLALRLICKQAYF